MASEKRKGLGKGFEQIFGENVADVLEEIQRTGTSNAVATEKQTVRVDEVRPNPFQPRTVFDPAKLEELAQSIREHGVFTPILVKKSIRGYDLVAGERRLRASKMAGLVEIPAIVVEFTDDQMMEIALLENIQREDLSVIEEANAYHKMMNRFGYTQEQLASRVGKSREYIANTLRLLKLPKDVQAMVSNNELQMGHVRALLSLEPAEISKVAKKIAQEGMSVRSVEAYVRELNNPKEPKKKQPTTLYEYPERLISDRLGTKVSIKNKVISIRFENDDDLNRILELMNMIEE